jgi:uncharacterized membrane protein
MFSIFAPQKNIMDARVKAIIAHLTPIGWLIALIINSSDKEEYTTFYLRQMLGIYLIGFILKFVPVIGWALAMVVFAFWVLSLVYAVKGEMKSVPYGHYFQEWFKAL